MLTSTACLDLHVQIGFPRPIGPDSECTPGGAQFRWQRNVALVRLWRDTSDAFASMAGCADALSLVRCYASSFNLCRKHPASFRGPSGAFERESIILCMRGF